MSLTTAACFIVCHGGPADHFATFIESLPKEKLHTIEVYASGPALQKLEEYKHKIAVKIVPFSLDNISPEQEDTLAKEIARACSTAKVVITDVGHTFDIKVQKALARQAAHVPRLAYYDNPEPYVPGSYSEIASKVMQAAQCVLFANFNLSQTAIFQSPDKKVDLGNIKKIGIGYYPVNQAIELAKQRAKKNPALRQSLFQKNGLVDKGQQILVYFGGNNDEYFKAIKHFLVLLDQGMKEADFSNLVIVLQQHPGAKTSNIDGDLFKTWIEDHKQISNAPNLIISDLKTEDVQKVTDGALYYQTSMSPQFVLAGIPTIQVGHKRYEDLLVRKKIIPSVTEVDELICCIGSLNQQNKENLQKNAVFESLGFKEDWPKRIEEVIKETSTTSSFSTLRTIFSSSPSSPLSYLAMKKLSLVHCVAASTVICVGFLAMHFFRHS